MLPETKESSTYMTAWVYVCYFSRNYFWKSNVLSQDVLAENGFCHEIATQGHSRSLYSFGNQLPADKG